MVSQASQLLLATSNPGKARELKALLGGAGLPVVSALDLQLDLQIEETGEDYESNARLKALRYANAADLWAVADDSGLEVEALDGAPGLYSSRWAGEEGTDADRRARLLAELEGHPRPWSARFVCTMVLADASGVLAVTRGECRGEISEAERGQGGFGYDPIFLVEGSEQTMAELPALKKNRLSHRGRAGQAMVPIIKRLLTESG